MYIPTQLTLLTTSQCTAKCGHCSVNSGPERRDRLDFNRMKQSIDGTLARGGLRTVIWAGGEPTMVGDHLNEAIAYATSFGLNTRIVTNASWAINDAKAHKKISELLDAGLKEINISADDYHLPYIPLDNVRTAWNASKGKGFRTVLIANSFGPNSKITPDYIASFLNEDSSIISYKEDVESDAWDLRGADGTAYIICGTGLQRLGRSHSEMGPDDVENIEWARLRGGCPYAARSPAISPKNHLVACCGIEAENNQMLDFGSLEDESFAEIFSRVDKNILVEAISMKGPAFIADFVRSVAPEVTWRESYGSVCEVCEHVTSRSSVLEAIELHKDAFVLSVMGLKHQ